MKPHYLQFHADDLRSATRDDAAEVGDILTAAFADDPPARWLFPEAGAYARDFPDFAHAFAGAALGLGTADLIPGRAAALWLPPGVQPAEEPIVAVLQRTIAPQRQEAVFALFGALGAAHPVAPHWYLPLIGVDPAAQGCGLGSHLLARALDRCDAAGLPAYLEASSPRNVPLYRRHGFMEVGAITAGDCPPITALWQEPQGRR